MKEKIITLREKQLEAFERCKDEKRFGVFFDMNVGKTATMLQLIDYLAFETLEVSNILIIAPATVVTKAKVWQKEIEKWKNFSYFDFIELSGTQKQRKEKKENSNNTITLMSDSLVVWYKETYDNLDDFDMVIIDESSRFKNPTSQKFKALSKMLKPKHRVYLLSGTPMPNGFQDLWSQMYLLDEGQRLESNFYKFLKLHAYYINQYKYVFTKTTKNALTERIKDICMFADDSDIKLPDKEEHLVMLNWGEEKKEKFKEFKTNYILEITKEKEITVLSAKGIINKTLQLANGGIYVDKDLNYEIFDSHKLDWVKNFSKTARDNMLIFYSFKFDKKRLMELEGAREIMTDVDVDDWNAGKIKIGIISPYSFQYGANLQYGGSIVVWYGLLWGLENYLQSNRRVWRYGQKNKVDIYYLLMEDTTDLLVYQRLVSKDLDEQEFLDKIKTI